MSNILPRLRMNLDFMPSPIEDHPGLLIRDTYRYSDATLIIPPVLIAAMEMFDGKHTELDLRAELVRLTGELEVGPLVTHLTDTLSQAGFLENEVYEEMREQARREFAASAKRDPVHAGGAYPADEQAARDMVHAYMRDAGTPEEGKLVGIAAPHVSPFGGWETYRDAYAALRPDLRDRTFVILGTSHYGDPDRFGLTRKPFITPFGETRTELGIVDRLASQPAVLMEDYCHAVEHSIEFQVLFLQYLFGPDIKIVPILCGSFGNSVYNGGRPEDNDSVRRFFGELAEIGATRTDLLWVLGIDMAHMGRRYGDPFTARANEDRMVDVQYRDNARIERVDAGDAHGFWDLVKENFDDLKWCGSSPTYTFMQAMPDARGKLRGYQQWNIDEQSVVSFAALSFTR